MKQDTPLFWESRFLNLHRQLSCQEIKLFGNDVNSNYQVTVELNEKAKEIRIPGSITFGGFWPQKKFFGDFSEIFLNFMDTNQEYNLKEIKLPPGYFHPDVFDPQLRYFLDTYPNNYIIETNNHVELSNWRFNKLSHGNRKKIKQFTNQGGQVRKAELSEYGLCIDILIQNRKNIGINLSLSKNTIFDLLIELPEFYTFYLAEIDSRICSVALLVSVDKFVNYVLYWGENLEFRHLSPVTALFEELVKISITSDKLYLDLGISSLNGEINEGLYRYKKNLGSEDSKKYIFKL
jgi:hypothetical protein